MIENELEKEMIIDIPQRVPTGATKSGLLLDLALIDKGAETIIAKRENLQHFGHEKTI